MNSLTPEGEQALTGIAQRYNISLDSAISMFHSVNNGGGTMAQFSIPELGSGQWMQGGMTMCGDMFNHGLQAMVSNLCGELSMLLSSTQVLKPAPKGSGAYGSGSSWYPAELGVPNSSGGQNGMQYAYFSASCRLAISINGEVSIFDTMDHQIGGVQQQQGDGSSLTFTSQYGTFSSLSLPLISNSGNNNASTITPEPTCSNVTEQPLESPSSTQLANKEPSHTSQAESNDILENIKKLGDLQQAGVLTAEEFTAKKAELLNRL